MHGPEGQYIHDMAYHTLDGLYDDARGILAASRFDSDWVEIGRSAQDNPIHAVCLGNGDFRKPELLYISGVHPMEFIGPRMNLEMLRRAASGDSEPDMAEILSKVNIWFLPVFNPDGYLKVQEQLKSPLGLVYVRTNSRGVDLNRNFPAGFYKHTLNLSPFSGSILPFSPYYHGPEPCSEPETRTLRDLVLGRNFKIAADLHSFGNAVFYPYGYTDKPCRHEETFLQVGREMIKRQRPPKYKIMPSYRHYRMTGDICDWLYDEFSVLAFTIELGGFGLDLANPKTFVNPFYWANPAEPESVTAKNISAFLYLAEALAEMFG